jgi:hypothetical protein
MQLKISKSWEVVFEWISYNQFNDLKEIGRDSIVTAHSGIWKDGPLRNIQENQIKKLC